MEERDDICFFDQRFLNEKNLDDLNVLEYFSFSPFYDRSCNNEILKMQTQFRGLNQESKLQIMVGVFYELLTSNPEKTLFVIRKAYNSGCETSTMAMYYIIHGYVYAAPTNYSIYRCRMSDAAWRLYLFIEKMIGEKKFNPFGLYRESKTKTTNNSGNKEELAFMMEVFNDFKKSLDD